VTRPRSLTFRVRYVPAILAGHKTATVRGLRTPQYPPGEVVEARTHWSRPPFARIEITDARTIPVAQLRRADALRAGSPTRAALLEAVRGLYPHDERVRVIGFRLVT
jgi:uncharacterized protein YqfB (UPF0267 family)